MKDRINVTKTFLPPISEYQEYQEKIWQSSQLTNQGQFLIKLENEIKEYTKTENFHFVTNGTIALQVAMRALDITEGEVITTPFSYVATTSAILWERCTPVYVDIDPETLCIDANKIEAAITDKTKAIMAVHVFGMPCDVEKIEEIAKKHNLKVIYDAAHAFSVEYKGKALFEYGDISVCSFHSTKLFHTIEGGGIFVKDKEVSEKVELVKRFGHESDDHYMLGINAKASEFQAAMGLCNLKYLEENIKKRNHTTDIYDTRLSGLSNIKTIDFTLGTKHNYAYYPIICRNEQELLSLTASLNKENIYPRRYFYPSLNNLPYIDTAYKCPISEDIALKILCLPLYADLDNDRVEEICEIIKKHDQ